MKVENTETRVDEVVQVVQVTDSTSYTPQMKEVTQFTNFKVTENDIEPLNLTIQKKFTELKKKSVYKRPDIILPSIGHYDKDKLY